MTAAAALGRKGDAAASRVTSLTMTIDNAHSKTIKGTITKENIFFQRA
jgi:hypothetical protein